MNLSSIKINIFNWNKIRKYMWSIKIQIKYMYCDDT